MTRRAKFALSGVRGEEHKLLCVLFGEIASEQEERC